jgi:halogenation protein CepH
MEPVAGEYDVVVVGGGPGGAAAATILADRGHRVLVLERARFPRHHVGESLVWLWPALRTLGVENEADRVFVHKRGASHVWGRDRSLWTVTFKNSGAEAGDRDYSLLVHRATFDQLLLDRARAAGAVVREGYRVAGLEWSSLGRQEALELAEPQAAETGGPVPLDRLGAVRYRTEEGTEGVVRARFVVDASGRARLLARRLRLLRTDPFYPDLALYGYFTGGGRLPGEYAGNVLVEATPDGWAWHIPLHTGEVSVGVVVAREARPALARARWPRYFRAQLAQTVQVRALLRGATLVHGPLVGASDSYRARRYAGPGWLLVGDAGCSIDPMWSSGVAIALGSGLMAGICLDAVLDGVVGERAALAYYQRGFRSQVSGLDWLTKQAYRANRLFPDAPFWQRCRRWRGADRPPAGLLARLAGDPSLDYYRETLGLMGATDAHGRALGEDGESSESRRARLDVVPFERCSLRLRPGVRLARGAVLQDAHLVPGTALRLPAGGGEVGLPAGLDWARAFARLAAGATVEAVVESGAPPDYAAVWRHTQQVLTLRQLYLEGFLDFVA